MKKKGKSKGLDKKKKKEYYEKKDYYEKEEDDFDEDLWFFKNIGEYFSLLKFFISFNFIGVTILEFNAFRE